MWAEAFFYIFNLFRVICSFRFCCSFEYFYIFHLSILLGSRVRTWRKNILLTDIIDPQIPDSGKFEYGIEELSGAGRQTLLQLQVIGVGGE